MDYFRKLKISGQNHFRKYQIFVIRIIFENKVKLYRITKPKNNNI